VFTAHNQAINDKVESMFLANSFDLIELLVQFGIAHLYPQLQGCQFVEELRAK
jgi:hypothetical protein